MKTPCQITPEAWVSDSDQLRAEAKAECLTCPVLKECKAGRFSTELFGVIGGVDHGVRILTLNQATATERANETKPCATCKRPFKRKKRGTNDWAKVRFCSRKCYGASKSLIDVEARKDCEECGATYTRGERSRAQWEAAKFCGVSCHGKSRRRKRAA